MAKSIYGTGTVYYGKTDFWPGESYITTEFIAALWVPLIPIRSLRVRMVDRDFHHSYPTFGFHTEYIVFSTSKPNVAQTARIYAFCLSCFLASWGWSVNFDRRDWADILSAFVVWGALSLGLFPAALRLRARHAILRELFVDPPTQDPSVAAPKL